jgi:hypothetical protein
LPAFPGLWLLGRGSRSAQPNLDVAGSFGELIRRTRVHSGERVVVLVDEYDKPILDNLAAPEVARAMHDGLHNLYSVIKSWAPMRTCASPSSPASVSG